MVKAKSKGRTWEEAAAAPQLPDQLAKYYLQWHQNCLDSIRWLAGLDPDPDIPCTYRDDEIEWLVDYYEQRAMLHWCAAVRAGVVK